MKAKQKGLGLSARGGDKGFWCCSYFEDDYVSCYHYNPGSLPHRAFLILEQSGGLLLPELTEQMGGLSQAKSALTALLRAGAIVKSGVTRSTLYRVNPDCELREIPIGSTYRRPTGQDSPVTRRIAALSARRTSVQIKSPTVTGRYADVFAYAATGGPA